MDDQLAILVRSRALDCCEYCRMRQRFTNASLQFDHVIAIKHRGPTIASNLALACLQCNACKGTNIAGIDPITRKITRLFHPRIHKWSWHFRWSGPVLIGRTAIGRTTIAVLDSNSSDRIAFRQGLFEEGVFPFDD